jgi:S-formylglutathione hydrolase FrmB
MPLAHIRFHGDSIGLATAMNVILPGAHLGSGPFPVFYLLHGLSDDESIWIRRTSIERYVDNTPLIVVMPTTARGWYTDSRADANRAYEKHIVSDVVSFVDRTFKTIPERKGRVVGGLSMGGYGAVKLALKYPDMFLSATSHSGAVAPFRFLGKDKQRYADIAPEFRAIFGDEPRDGENDPMRLAERCPRKLRPALRIDCGKADHLLQQNRDFHQRLVSLRYPHEYHELPSRAAYQDRGPLSPWTGGHDWNYWDLAVQHALVFHCRQLGISLPAERNPRVARKASRRGQQR